MYVKNFLGQYSLECGRTGYEQLLFQKNQDNSHQWHCCTKEINYNSGISRYESKRLINVESNMGCTTCLFQLLFFIFVSTGAVKKFTSTSLYFQNQFCLWYLLRSTLYLVFQYFDLFGCQPEFEQCQMLSFRRSIHML